jgi:hypothetical protein
MGRVFVVFDPATVGRGVKKRVFDLPGGAPRLDTDALGVHGQALLIHVRRR